MTLANGCSGNTYTIKSVSKIDEELTDFLFTLGCYSGEEISVVSKVGESLVIAIKDGRYNIDRNLAELIEI